MDARCRIELLGGLRVTQGERVVTRFRTQKAGSLLAYLAYYRAQSHPRERLIELLWPEVEPAAGRHRLNMTLSFLRRPLEPPGVPAGAILMADRTTVGLNPLGITTDVAEFEAALAQAVDSESAAERCRLLKEAITLYRGELLPGCYEDWVQIEQQRLAEQFLQALHQGSAHALEMGDRDSALNFLLRAVSLDPLREELHLDIMRLYAAADRPADALRQYHDLERLLETALGVEPTQEARELAETLARDAGQRTRAEKPRKQTPKVSETPPPVRPDEHRTPDAAPRLPLQFTRFFGREAEIAHLQAMLGVYKSNPATPPSPDDSPVRLVTLSGPGGSGKTRLAIEVVRQSADAFGGAVWFVPLADLSDPRLIPEAILEALRLPRSPHIEPLEQVIAFLNRVHDEGTGQACKPGPTLLLLDNFEHLLAQERRKSEDGAAVVRTLLDRIPTLILLVTSRQLLSLEGEREFMVAPLRTPPSEHHTPEQAVQYASVQLFTDRAQTIKPDFQVTRNNAAAIATLCTRLEGMPLALELAAARAQVLTPAQMLQQLERRFDFLVSRRRDAVERHRTLRTAIDWSYRLLSPQVQRFFARLSVFRGGWTAEAAASVCKIEVENALDYLTQLRECTLVQTQASDSEMRFQMLETLREYTVEQLSLQECDDLERLHAAYYQTLAEETEPRLKGPDQREALSRLAADHDNLRLAMAWCGTHDIEAGLRMTAALEWFWLLRSDFREEHEWSRQVLAKSVNMPSLTRAKALAAAGHIAAKWGNDYAQARALGEESLRLAQAHSDKQSIARALRSLGCAALFQTDEDWERARAFFQESASLYQELGAKWDVAFSRFFQGLVASEYDEDYTAARALYEQSVTLFREVGDRWGTALPLSHLGGIAIQQGDYATVLSLYAARLRQAQELGEKHSVAVCLGGLADMACRQGRYVRAARLTGASDAHWYAVSDPEEVPKCAEAPYVAAVRAALGEEAFVAAWAEGEAMTMEQAIASALEEDTT
jgi:predicted ATPase/DNA-binding SARP family transcriptional activator